VTLVDAPLSRTPAQAWSGELTTFVGGPAELVERWRPLLSTWASVVIPVGGPVGSAHALKLVNNLVALGYAAIWAECFAMARKVGVAPAVFREVISNSGMNCLNFQNFAKYPVEGDREGHKFSIANAFKDLAYYERMATRHRAATLMSDGALQTLKLGMAMGMGERYVPEMTDIVLALNEPKKG
jgi:3-hydroxyisobutyrate dehydrogenase-like beta-hydroxyacid dehydrogenase